MILQLHITGRCNLRCKHCYIEEHATEMPFEDIERVLKQFERLILWQELVTLKKGRGFVNITGGEPFLHRDIMRVIELCRGYSGKFAFSFLTNGTVIGDGSARAEEILGKLSEIPRCSVQVSVDGKKNTHDFLRAEGNFDRSFAAVEAINRHGLFSKVSFTANADNFREFPEVAAVCREKGAGLLWSDRYIPVPNGTLKTLSPEEFTEYAEILEQERQKSDKIHNGRALQFLPAMKANCGSTNVKIYKCNAAAGLIVVDEYGNVMPCRRLPIVCGNIKNTSLSRVYFLNKDFRTLRKHKISGKCKKCKYKKSCAGGLRCLAYAVNGNYISPDPACPVKL